MSRKWTTAILAFLVASSVTALAAKPPKEQPQPVEAAPELFSVKIDYINGFIVAEGANLSPGTATASLAGVSLTLDPASTESELLFAFSDDLSAVVNELGNYVLNLTTDGGSITLTAFIPFALAPIPEPPPPGVDCPCSTEWDLASITPSPDGFAELTPYCSENNSDFFTVQFYDMSAGNYWVLWANWDDVSNSGSCELYIDGPNRTLDTQTQFDACAAYLQDMVTVWGNQGNVCMF